MPGGQFGSGRTLTCVHCHAVVLVCPRCDRGQRYCSARCRDQARRVAQRQAGGRYQSTPRGRSAHALRQQRYRARGEQKKVTHQGSQGALCGDVLASELSVGAPAPVPAPVPAPATCKVALAWHCHWCGRTLAGVIRHDVLRHATLQEPLLAVWFGGIARGRSP